MSKLPVLSYKKLVKVLVKKGFIPRRQSGSHIILTRREPKYLAISVPKHREIKKGTLKAILIQIELDVEELLEMLE
jgi:predicted RNA binding protein YcfA (HicA-like mRNA interferase family)